MSKFRGYKVENWGIPKLLMIYIVTWIESLKMFAHLLQKYNIILFSGNFSSLKGSILKYLQSDIEILKIGLSSTPLPRKYFEF